MLELKFAAWKRRVVTRLVVILPTVIVTSAYPSQAANMLLTSQIILSFALTFALVPLVWITRDVRKMGKEFVNWRSTTAVASALVLAVLALNLYLISSPSTWAFLAPASSTAAPSLSPTTM